jgi:sigma-54 dependent transcriptional regulator, flagellar regulatory protein
MADLNARMSFLGQSSGAVHVRQLLEKVAPSQATVLINGESGTGKELVARSLHELSDRKHGNFVTVNCGAIPRELLESELFGHRKGSFTGASSDRIGRFELAHGGTIFLDEIGDMPMEMQVKLLRVLQERNVEAVGGSKPVPIDVRVVAASHKDLEAEIAGGRFREDLFYRLNVLPIHIPPLRERSEDIPELLQFYAQKFKIKGHSAISFSPEFLKVLTEYDWPGNVRELSNLVDRFTALFFGQRLELAKVPASFLPKGLRHLQLGSTDLLQATLDLRPPSNPPLQLFEESRSHSPFGPEAGAEMNEVEEIIMRAQGLDALPSNGLSLKEHLAEVERNLIMQALERSRGNVSQTARLLNVQRTTLIVKLDKYELRYNPLGDAEGLPAS